MSRATSSLCVLKVWDAEYPWDVRAEKVCHALTASGHRVHMVARNRDARPLRETLPECTVHRLRPWRFLGPRLDAASQFPAFINPRWRSLIARTARATEADCILVRDLPLAPAALRVGRTQGRPVVLDMAENYPAMIRDLWTTGATKLGDAIVRNPRAVAAVERRVLARVDHVLVVVEESRDRLLAMGVPADRITIVGNTPQRARVTEFAAIRAAAREQSMAGAPSPRPLRLAYLGLMEEARGVRLVLDAVALARGLGVAVELDLIGDGRALGALRRRAGELGLTEPSVRFHGHMPYREALARVAQADAGLIPHFADEAWETTIPNKLFDYMSLGVAVIASNVTPVVRVLKSTGAGVVFRDRSADDLARVLGELARSSRSEAMGALGTRAVLETFHWERDAERLDAALRHVVRAAMPSV